MVSEWRSVIAVSLNVGGGVRLIKPAKLYTCKQKHYTHDEDGRTAPGVCGNGSIPLSHSGNVVTRIGIHTHTHNSSPYIKEDIGDFMFCRPSCPPFCKHVTDTSEINFNMLNQFLARKNLGVVTKIMFLTHTLKKILRTLSL